MAVRSQIIAGKAVIVIEAHDLVDKALRTIRNKMLRFSAQMNKLGQDSLRAGIALSIPTALLGREFVKFEDALLRVEARLGATQDQFRSLTSVIRELGRTTSFTATEVAQGAEELAKAGFSAAEVMSALQPVLALARGGDISLGQSGRIIADLIRTFQLTAKDAPRVASILTVASNNATVSVENLVESLKEVSGTLTNVNTPLHTSVALVAALGSRSLKGTKAGTSLNTAILNLTNNAHKLNDALGIDPFTNKGDLKDPIGLLEEVFKAANKLGTGRRIAVLQDIFNIRGGRAVSALIPQLREVVELQTKLAKATNEAQIQFEKFDSGLGGALRRFRSAVESFNIDQFSKISEKLEYVFDVATRAINALEKQLQKNPALIAKWVGTMLAIPPVLIGVGVGLLGVAKGLDIMATGLTGTIALWSRLSSVMSSVLGANKRAFGALLSTPGAIAAAQQKASKAQAARQARNAAEAIRAARAARIAQLAEQRLLSSSTRQREYQPRRRRRRYGRPSGDLFAMSGLREGAASRAGLAELFTSAQIRTGTKRLEAARQQRIASNQRFARITRQSEATRFRAGAMIVRPSTALARGPSAIGQTAPRAIGQMTARVKTLSVTTNQIARRGFFSRTVGRRIGQLFRFLSTKGAPAVGNLAVGFGKISAATAKGIFNTANLTRLGKGLLTVANTLKNITMFLLRATAIGLRFVFSFNGLLIVTEILLLLRDRLAIVNTFVTTIGKAFSGLGKGIADAVKSLGFLFSAAKEIKDLFAQGDYTEGLDLALTTLRNIGSLIKNNLVAGWMRFAEQIRPTVDLISSLWTGIKGVGSSLISFLPGTKGGTASQGSYISPLTASIQEFSKTAVDATFSVGTSITKAIYELLQGLTNILIAVVTGLEELNVNFASYANLARKVPDYATKLLRFNPMLMTTSGVTKGIKYLNSLMSEVAKDAPEGSILKSLAEFRDSLVFDEASVTASKNSILANMEKSFNEINTRQMRWAQTRLNAEQGAFHAEQQQREAERTAFRKAMVNNAKERQQQEALEAQGTNTLKLATSLAANINRQVAPRAANQLYSGLANVARGGSPAALAAQFGLTEAQIINLSQAKLSRGGVAKFLEDTRSDRATDRINKFNEVLSKFQNQIAQSEAAGLTNQADTIRKQKEAFKQAFLEAIRIEALPNNELGDALRKQLPARIQQGAALSDAALIYQKAIEKRAGRLGTSAFNAQRGINRIIGQAVRKGNIGDLPLPIQEGIKNLGLAGFLKSMQADFNQALGTNASISAGLRGALARTGTASDLFGSALQAVPQEELQLQTLRSIDEKLGTLPKDLAGEIQVN